MQMRKNSHRLAASKTEESGEPRFGIFWLVKKTLVIDSTRLSEADDYGDFKTHSRSHLDVWEQFQRDAKVPRESEYEEFPRGRVTYNRKTRRFTLLADSCILRAKGIVTKIMSEMNLPRKTETDIDSHYRCFACLQGASD
jgi:hypothetical protein